MVIDEFKYLSKVSDETIKSVIGDTDEREIKAKFMQVTDNVPQLVAIALLLNACQCAHYVAGFIAAVEMLECVRQQKEIDALEDIVK